MAPRDLLIYALIFLGILLFNILRQRGTRRQQEEQAAQQAEPQPEEPLPEEPLQETWGRRPSSPVAVPRQVLPVQEALRTAEAPASPAPPRRRSAAAALLGSRRDLRRAIVLMTVLGPCRAQEPPER